MMSFRSWMNRVECAVPQTVDLTNGGKNDQGVSYWGAISKKGTKKKVSNGRAQSKTTYQTSE